MPNHGLRLIECKSDNQQKFIYHKNAVDFKATIKGVSVSTQKGAQKLSCATWATVKGKTGGPDFQPNRRAGQWRSEVS